MNYDWSDMYFVGENEWRIFLVERMLETTFCWRGSLKAGINIPFSKISRNFTLHKIF